MKAKAPRSRKLRGWIWTVLSAAVAQLLCCSPAIGSEDKPKQTIVPHFRTTKLIAHSRSQSSQNEPQASDFDTAAKEMKAGEILRQSGVADDLRRAFKHYDTARTLWQRADDKFHLALTLLRIGQVLSALHDDAQSAKFLDDGRQLAREIDESNIEAESEVASGMLRLRHGDLKAALIILERAHDIGVSKKNRVIQATAFASLSEIHYHLGDMGNASNAARESLEISKEIGSQIGVTRALYWLGCISMAKRDYENALRLLQDSLVAAREADNLPSVVDSLTQIGGFYSMVGEKQKALDIFVDLEPRAELLQDPERLARVYNGLDSVNQELGNIELSLQYCQKTIEMYHAANYAIGEAQIRVRLGGIQTRMGQYATALNNYQRSLTFFLQNGMTRNTYYVLSDIGELYAAQANDLMASQYYARAEELIKAADDPREYSYLLIRMARISEHTGNVEGALKRYREALKLNRSNKDLFGESQTWYLMAGAEKKLSHPTEAAIAIKAAIDIDERVRDEVAVSGLRASYFAEVNQHFDFYIDLLMSESRPDGSNEIKGLEISERKRARSLLDEVAFSSRVTSAANGDVAALVERERKLKTQIEAKRDEYATLRQDKLSTSHAEQTAAELLRLNQEYDQLHSVTLSQDISRSPKIPPRPLTAKEIQNVVDDDSTLLLEFSLGEERTFLWAISRGAIESYELPKRSIIEQQVLELNRAIRTMIRRQTPIGDKEAGPSVVRSDEDFQKHAQALSKILLAPAARHITSAKRIVIIPDGALHYVPFAALPQLDWSAYGPATASNLHGPSTSRPLLADYEITLIPSVSFLVAFRDRVEGVPGPSKNIAIIANPVFEKNDERLLSKQSGSLARIGLSQQGPASSGAATEEPDMKKMLRETDRRRTEKAISQLLRDTESESGTLPRLFSTQREALEIQSLAGLGNSLVAINFDANRKILTSGTLKDYRFIHFATHGFFDSLHPELSGIVLSLFDEQGRPQNGFIQISDLYNLNLSAELVVLSACQTGLGKQVKGEGVMGLTRAFMAAGAHRVVASLWKVDDDATSELMARFYRHLLKEKATPSAALRAAQLEISVKPKWRQPFYWAGFFITGDFH